MFAQAPGPAVANPIAASQKNMYTMLSGVVIAAAQKMPEENYAFKPAPEVRSFGQLVGHLADSQYYFCSLAAGDTQSARGVEKSTTSKEALIAALKEAVAYCGKTYAAMTDSKGSEMVKLMNRDFARLAVLSANTAHDYEHYGNMATYMRIKGVVPPTSEKAPAPEQK
jgi:uncharacterized damage-inducible protein DinB